MWQVKLGCRFAFLKRCSKLSSVNVSQRGGRRTGNSRGIEIQSFTFHSWAVPHHEKTKGACLSEGSVGCALMKDPKHEGIALFLLFLSPVFMYQTETKDQVRYGEPHPSPNSSLTSHSFPTMLCQPLHIRHHL